MEITYLIKGIIIGIIISAPIGPVAALCVQRTLTEGKISGFITGVGAASADILYALIALYGLSFISLIIVKEEFWIRLVGGIILLLFGIKVYFMKSRDGIESKAKDKFQLFGTAFILTLSNPIVIFSFMAVFSVLGIVNPVSNQKNAGLMILGIYSAALLVWFAVAYLASIFREKANSGDLHIVNKTTGIIIMLCSFYSFWFVIKVIANKV